MIKCYLKEDIFICQQGTQHTDMQKDNFFLHKHGLSQKKIYPKKCVNYDKSKSRQNSVKGPTDPNSAEKMPKTNINFQNVPKNATKKCEIA